MKDKLNLNKNELEKNDQRVSFFNQNNSEKKIEKSKEKQEIESPKCNYFIL